MSLKEFSGGLEGSEPKEVVVGIDQSYRGFAITALAKEGDPLYHTWVFKSDGVGVERLKNIRKFLQDIIEGLNRDGFKVVDSAIEAYAFSRQLAHMAGELGATVKLTLDMVCRGTDAQYPMIVGPTVLKKFVTGKGNVEKNQMLLNVFKNWGIEFTDDNACDSYCLARIVSGRAEYAHQRKILGDLASPEARERPVIKQDE